MHFPTIILAIAKSVGVSGSLLLAICTHESNLRNILVPHDGGSPSYGLCQIKYDTAKELGMKDGEDLMNPNTNILYAAKYLKKQLERYDGDLCKSVAAYNTGTYLPSTVSPGKPKNLKYINKIILHLDDEHKDMLVCGAREIEQ